MKRSCTEEGMTKLDWAIEENDFSKVQELIESGEARVSKELFGGAVHSNHQEIVKYFLKKTSDIHEIAKFGLRIAIKNNNLEIVKLIVQALRDSESIHQNADSVIFDAIYAVWNCHSSHTMSDEESIRLVKLIIDTYTK